jgi:putative ABC transport system permease protein
VFRNYLSAALRNLARNRAVTLINVAGLAIGFSAALLTLLYVRYEHSYEKFIPGYENVYRFSGGADQERSSFRVAKWLDLNVPEVEASGRLLEFWHSVGTDEQENMEQVFEADASFFRIVPVKTIAGDLANALNEPETIAISRSIARKYFGRDDAVGQIIKFGRMDNMRVTAVFEDLPANTHLNFRIVVSANTPYVLLPTLDKDAANPAVENPVHTYIRLRAGADIAAVRARLAGTPHAAGTLLPIADIHLAPEGERSLRPRGNPTALAALTLVGFLIVLIAVINFVNLTTARAAHRSVEVAVRKLAGARRRDLLLQFMGETFLLVAVAMLLAVSLVEIALPAFRALLAPGELIAPAPGIEFDYWHEPWLLSGLGLGTLVVGALAAAYPAMMLSAFRPAAVLKGTAILGVSGARVRAGLVVLQLALLIGLVFATTVIFRQTDFALRAAGRIDTDQVVQFTLDIYGVTKSGIPAPPFRNAAAEVPGVRATTYSAATLTGGGAVRLPFRDVNGAEVTLQLAAAAPDFFEFYGVPLRAGRALSADLATDRYDAANTDRPLSVLINEAAALALGFVGHEDAVGKSLRADWPPGYQLAKPTSITIAGVVTDFPVRSIRQAIEPAVYMNIEPWLATMSLRLDAARIPETLAALRKLWREAGPPHAQSGTFLDGYYRQLYADIIQQQKALALFAGSALFLAALGLFGLSIHTTQRRTREIGIRKVMGASTGAVLRLLLAAFCTPVIWASLIAWPVVAWLMHGWLEGFAYRVGLGWQWLAASSVAAVVVAVLTVSAQSFVVARRPPAGALRYE